MYMDPKRPRKPSALSTAQRARKEALHLERLQRVADLAQDILRKIDSGQFFNRPYRKAAKRSEAASNSVLIRSSNGISIYGPAVKPAYTDFKAKLRSEGTPITGTLTIKYKKSCGEESARKISLLAIHPPLNPTYVLAQCHLRSAERTFSVANICEAVDDQSGQRIEDLPLWLTRRIGA
jgi:hypothetical protein